MKTKQYKGFGSRPSSSEQVDEKVKKLFAQYEIEIEELRGSLADPSARGQIDALFGQPCALEETRYKEAYLEVKLALELAPPETVRLFKDMKPLVKDLLQEVHQCSQEK